MELSRTFTFRTFHQTALHQWFNDLQLDGAMHKQQTLLYTKIEPRCEKTGLRGFRPGRTQTGLCSHGFRKKRDCTTCVAKTKALIRCAVTAQLICGFVFTNAKSRFSHNEAQILNVCFHARAYHTVSYATCFR